jgi:hypothetical protein
VKNEASEPTLTYQRRQKLNLAHSKTSEVVWDSVLDEEVYN